MSDKADHSSSSSNEIDLLDLLLILWKKRIILALSAIVFSSLGVLLAQTHTPTYKGEVQVHQLNEIEMAGFDNWNQGVRVANLSIPTMTGKPLTGLDNTGTDLSRITSKSLANTFNARYRRGDALVAALRRHSAAVQNFNGDEEELDLMLNGMLNNFALTEDAKSGEVSIVFTTSDKAESFKILSSTLDLISTNSKSDILRSIQSKLEATGLSRNLQLDQIAAQLEGYSRLYAVRKERSLTLLREQADIARNLAIETPSYAISPASRQAQSLETPPSRLDSFESQYFLQGYRAIEKQISNIEQREDTHNFPLVAEIDRLVLNRTLVEKHNILEMMTPLMQKLPFHDQDFTFVRVDLGKIKFESEDSSRLIAIFVALAGVLITAFLIILGHAVKRRIRG